MSDKLDSLKAELEKETLICRNPNASKYHKQRLSTLKDQVKSLTAKENPKKEAPKEPQKGKQ